MSKILLETGDDILLETGDFLLIEDPTFYINGVDKTSLIDWTSVKKNETATKQADTLDFCIKNFGTKTYRPVMNDIVQFNDGSTKLFEGLVVQSTESIDGLAKYFYVTCKDYTHTLDRQLVSKVYTGQTATAIVQDLISTFTTGFTTTNVVAGVVIERIAFNYLTVSQCLEKLTKMLNGYSWYVDYDKDIHFFATVLNLAPFSLTDTSQNFTFGTLDIKQDTHQLRNDIYIRGGNIISASARTEYFSGDATKLIFPLGLKYNVEPTVTVGGVGKTVGLENIDVAGSNDCYWDFNQKTLRFETAPAAGTNNIVVSGTYLYPLVYRKQNNSSVLTYGVFQYIIIDKTITSTDAASQRADAEIAQYSTPTNYGTFQTNTSGLIAGQRITINSTIRGINEDYLIESIETRFKTPTALSYKVKIQSYASFGINDVLKKLLINNPADQLEIGENENVQRSVGFDESVVVTDTVKTPTKTSAPYKWGADANALIWNRGTWS